MNEVCGITRVLGEWAQDYKYKHCAFRQLAQDVRSVACQITSRSETFSVNNIFLHVFNNDLVSFELK